MHYLSQKFIGLGAVTAAALMPVALAAQQYSPGSSARSSPVARYNLIQLTVQREDISYADFKVKTGAIRSCGDAKSVAKELDAQTARNRFVTASRLPDAVQELLKDLPTGQATPVFSADTSVMRVIVICSRQ